MSCGCNKPVCQTNVAAVTTTVTAAILLATLLPKPAQYALLGGGTALALSYKLELPKIACEYTYDWPGAHELCDLTGLVPDSE